MSVLHRHPAFAGSFHLTESLPAANRKQTDWADVFCSFGTVLRNRRYLCYILQFGFSQGVLSANISSAPFIMQQHYGFSPMLFSVCFGANALAIVFSAALSVKFRHPEFVLYCGNQGMLAVSFLLLIAMGSSCSFWIYEILLLCLLVMLGLTFTSSNTLAMNAERQHAGIVSAVLGALGFAFGGIVSPLVGIGDIMLSTGIVFTLGPLGAFVCARISLRGLMKRRIAVIACK